METPWDVLLTYDAGQEFYEVLNENFDFKKIQNEVKDFRLSLILLLLDSGAYELESEAKSGVFFRITLPAGVIAAKHLENIFNKNFKKGDFDYMLQARPSNGAYKSFATHNKFCDHNEKFKLDVEKAKKLLPKIKKVG